jgi:hypothetical protein
MLFFTLTPSPVERFGRRFRQLILSMRLSDSRVDPLTGPDRSIRRRGDQLLAVSNFSGGPVTSTRARRNMVGLVLMLLADGFGGFGGMAKCNRDFMQALDASSIAEKVYRFRS